MKLSKRLQAVEKLIGPYSSVADIGSDHAYLPVALIASKNVSFVVAGEVNPGPLMAAKLTIAASGMEDHISARLGDGLQVLAPGEVEAVVIAGMGSTVIRGILERSPEVTGSLRRIICQPMAGAVQMRQWFQKQGWKLVEEDLVLEEGRLYEILAAEPGEMSPMEPMLLEIGPLLWQNRHPLLREHLKRLLQKTRKQSAAMAKSEDPDVLAKRVSCQEKIRMLEGMIQCVSIVE